MQRQFKVYLIVYASTCALSASSSPTAPSNTLGSILATCCTSAAHEKGRYGIEATDGAAMLRPIISGRHARDSKTFLRGLVCTVALARHNNPEEATCTTSGADNTRLRIPGAGGVGPSGPPRPHPLDLEGKLYVDLVDALDATPPAPLESVRALVRMKFLEPVLRFMAPDDDDRESEGMILIAKKVGGGDGSGLRGTPDGPHFFSLKQRHACLGTVAMHGLVVLAGPHPVFFSGRILRYLCYSIQIAYADISVGNLAPGVGYPLVFRSVQLACRALAFLATTDVAEIEGASWGKDEEKRTGEEFGNEQKNMAARHGALKRVADSLISTSAINEVACVAQMPSRAGSIGGDASMRQYLERTVSSAAVLIASVCPVPASERDPFVRSVLSRLILCTTETGAIARSEQWFDTGGVPPRFFELLWTVFVECEG